MMQWYTDNTTYDTLLLIGFAFAAIILLTSFKGTAQYGGRFGAGSNLMRVFCSLKIALVNVVPKYKSASKAQSVFSFKLSCCIVFGEIEQLPDGFLNV